MCDWKCLAAVLVLAISTQVYAGNANRLSDAKKSSEAGKDRIVGGHNADIRQFPHQISMRYRGRHRCGGSLYSANVVVSAAHCVVNTNVTELSIVAGSTLLSEKHIELYVLKYIVHEKYSGNDYDVAILIMKGLFPFNEFIQPIELATHLPEPGTEITVTGWGALVEGGSGPDHLQQVTVLLVSPSSCKKSYPLMITERMICAGVSGGGKDACQGDSGGPLIVNNQLLGVVSWGIGCAQRLFPGVYASVPTLHDWIVEKSVHHEFSFA